MIHPSVSALRWTTVGEGSIVCAGTILTCNIKIGKHAHLNLHTTIGHNCVIGEYFTSAPGVHVSGNCTFGNEVSIGTGASVREKLSICSGATIGMGAVLVKNIEEPGVYVWNPARKK
ncbi:hypothetical protein [Cesiribacter sp. SM1]|uniref:hypothetical protein n=1 Tax=Cesiribacter sp. SM1 TaxID=2861196 RepID=UPI001CD7A1D8|nr:hypothetical protein [Cesiribacter sp. SM1]